MSKHIAEHPRQEDLLGCFIHGQCKVWKVLLPLSIRSGSTLVLEWIAVHLTRYMSAVQVCSTRAVCLVVPYATIQLCCLEGIPQADTFQRSFATSRPQAFRNGQSLQENLISGTPPSFISFMQGNPSRNSHGTCSKNTEVSSLVFPTFFTLGD